MALPRNSTLITWQFGDHCSKKNNLLLLKLRNKKSHEPGQDRALPPFDEECRQAADDYLRLISIPFFCLQPIPHIPVLHFELWGIYLDP